MAEMKCGNPHGIPGCEWAEWKHHEKRIIEDWTGSPDDLELKLDMEFDNFFPQDEVSIIDSIPIGELDLIFDFEEEPPCEVFE